jgi:hypothetical protein
MRCKNDRSARQARHRPRLLHPLANALRWGTKLPRQLSSRSTTRHQFHQLLPELNMVCWPKFPLLFALRCPLDQPREELESSG